VKAAVGPGKELLVQAIDPVATQATQRHLQLVERRPLAPSAVSRRRNLASLGIALLLATLVLLAASALGLLIATSLYGYGGIA
jgi:hypothetical protein